MKLTPKEAAEARERALAYEANMAVEGLFISPESRALFDRMDAECVAMRKESRWSWMTLQARDHLCRSGQTVSQVSR